jgi:histidinol phosphatase-like enzyme
MATSANRVVFLDRDGVLNKVTVRNGKSYPPNAIDEFACYQVYKMSADF